MFKVSAWNQYQVSGNGKKVIAHEVDAKNVTEALNRAEFLARQWNKRNNKDWQVNILTCGGFVRAII